MKQLSQEVRSALNAEHVRDQLLDFIFREDCAERKEIFQTYNLPVEKRMKKNACMRNLKFQFHTTNGRLVYKYQSHEDLCFNEGGYFVINSSQVSGYDISKGTVMKLLEIDHSQTYLTFSLPQELEAGSKIFEKDWHYTLDKSYSGVNAEALRTVVNSCFGFSSIKDAPANSSAADLGEDFNPFELRHQKEQHLQVSEARGIEGLADLAALVLGGKRLSVSTHLLQQIDSSNEVERSGFTQRQKLAYETASCSPLTLIQGPPGTGKTRLLAQIIARAIRQGQSVLVTAYTHAAINNLLKAVSKALPVEDQIYKIADGTPSHMPPKGVKSLSLNNRSLNAVMEQPIVLGATVFQAHSLNRLKPNSFDLLIMDEAGQMPIAHGLAAMECCNNYVLAGDHKQLPPIQHVHSDRYTLQRSILEHLLSIYPQLNIALDVTFRMNSEINEFPSRRFYSGLLLPGKENAQRKFVPQSPAIDPQKIIVRSESVTFVEVEHSTCRVISQKEADITAQIAYNLLVHQGLSPTELAIITPFNKQRGKIRERLRKLLTAQTYLEPLRTLNEIAIDTIEKMQGQEREVVVLSLCASEPAFLKKRQDFLYQPNRLNVAITRGRSRLFIVASRNFFPCINGMEIDSEYALLFNDYYQYLLDKRVVLEDE